MGGSASSSNVRPRTACLASRDLSKFYVCEDNKVVQYIRLAGPNPKELSPNTLDILHEGKSRRAQCYAQQQGRVTELDSDIMRLQPFDYNNYMAVLTLKSVYLIDLNTGAVHSRHSAVNMSVDSAYNVWFVNRRREVWYIDKRSKVAKQILKAGFDCIFVAPVADTLFVVGGDWVMRRYNGKLDYRGDGLHVVDAHSVDVIRLMRYRVIHDMFAYSYKQNGDCVVVTIQPRDGLVSEKSVLFPARCGRTFDFSVYHDSPTIHGHVVDYENSSLSTPVLCRGKLAWAAPMAKAGVRETALEDAPDMVRILLNSPTHVFFVDNEDRVVRVSKRDPNDRLYINDPHVAVVETIDECRVVGFSDGQLTRY